MHFRACSVESVGLTGNEAWLPHKARAVPACDERYLVKLLLLLEGADVLPDLLHLLRASAFDDVVSARILVGCDEVWVIDAGQGHLLLHVGHQLPLQLPVQHLHSPLGGLH